MEKRIYNVDSNGKPLQKRAGGASDIYGDAEDEDKDFVETQRDKVIKVLTYGASQIKLSQELAELETAASLAYGDVSKVFESSILKLEQNGSDVCAYEAGEFAGLAEEFDTSMEGILDEINQAFKEAEYDNPSSDEDEPININQFKKDALAVIKETMSKLVYR